MRNLVSRMLGHVGWHYRDQRRKLRKLRMLWASLFPGPAIAGLNLRNFLSRQRITAPSGPVVSITSYGDRSKSVHIAIESIARGVAKPGRAILWLDDELIMMSLPAPLRRLRRRGLEIRLAESLGPHTKYFPYVSSESSFEAPLVTADDDVIYPSSWLAELEAAYASRPSVINCHRARVIGVDGGQFAPFRSWRFCESSAPSLGYFFEGVSGVIYPPQFLEVLKVSGRAFLELCPKHDDLWLNVIALRNSWTVAQIRPTPARFEYIPNTQDAGLWRQNIGEAGDAQIARVFNCEDIARLVRTDDSQRSQRLRQNVDSPQLVR